MTDETTGFDEGAETPEPLNTEDSFEPTIETAWTDADRQAADDFQAAKKSIEENPAPGFDGEPVDALRSAVDEVKGLLVNTVKRFARAQQEADIDELARLTALDLVDAIREDRQDLVAEIRSAMRTRAEDLRVEASEAWWEFIGESVDSVARIGIAFVRNAV